MNHADELPVSFRINAIEAELKHTHTSNGQMKKDVKELQKVRADVTQSLSREALAAREIDCTARAV